MPKGNGYKTGNTFVPLCYRDFICESLNLEIGTFQKNNLTLPRCVNVLLCQLALTFKQHYSKCFLFSINGYIGVKAPTARGPNDKCDGCFNNQFMGVFTTFSFFKGAIGWSIIKIFGTLGMTQQKHLFGPLVAIKKALRIHLFNLCT